MKKTISFFLAILLLVSAAAGVSAASPAAAVQEYVDSMGELRQQIEENMVKVTEEAEMSGIASMPRDHSYQSWSYYPDEPVSAADILSGAVTPTKQYWFMYTVSDSGSYEWITAEFTGDQWQQHVASSYRHVEAEDDLPPSYGELAEEIDEAVGPSVDMVRFITLRLAGQTDCFLVSSGEKVYAIVYYTKWNDPADASFFQDAPRTSRGHAVVDADEMIAYLYESANSEKEPASEGGTPDVPETPDEPEIPTPSDNLPWIIAGAAAVVIILGGAVLLVFLRKRGK